MTRYQADSKALGYYRQLKDSSERYHHDGDFAAFDARQWALWRAIQRPGHGQILTRVLALLRADMDRHPLEKAS